MANEVKHYYEPGKNITGRVTANVIGMRFVSIDAAAPAWQPEGLRPTAEPNVIPVRQSGAGERVFGVAQRDVAVAGTDSNQGLVTCIRGNAVVPVRAGAAIAPGTPVTSDAEGRAVPAAGTDAVAGVCCNATTAANQIAAISLDN